MKKRRSDGATKRRRGGARRRGIALLDALLGGVMLGVGLTVVLTISSRALNMQRDGEHRLVASWLADELLGMILVEGPDDYPLIYDTTGRFGDPFEGYFYDVTIEQIGRGAPYRVNAVVRWGDRGNQSVRVETLVALRTTEEDELREPYETVDRDERYFGEEEG